MLRMLYRGKGGEVGLDPRVHRLDVALHQRQQDVVLVGEVLVERGDGDARGLGDAARAHGLDAVGDHLRSGVVEDPLDPVAAAGLLGHPPQPGVVSEGTCCMAER